MPTIIPSCSIKIQLNPGFLCELWIFDDLCAAFLAINIQLNPSISLWLNSFPAGHSHERLSTDRRRQHCVRVRYSAVPWMCRNLGGFATEKRWNLVVLPWFITMNNGEFFRKKYGIWWFFMISLGLFMCSIKEMVEDSALSIKARI